MSNFQITFEASPNQRPNSKKEEDDEGVEKKGEGQRGVSRGACASRAGSERRAGGRGRGAGAQKGPRWGLVPKRAPGQKPVLKHPDIDGFLNGKIVVSTPLQKVLEFWPRRCKLVSFVRLINSQVGAAPRRQGTAGQQKDEISETVFLWQIWVGEVAKTKLVQQKFFELFGVSNWLAEFNADVKKWLENPSQANIKNATVIALLQGACEAYKLGLILHGLSDPVVNMKPFSSPILRRVALHVNKGLRSADDGEELFSSASSSSAKRSKQGF